MRRQRKRWLMKRFASSSSVKNITQHISKEARMLNVQGIDVNIGATPILRCSLEVPSGTMRAYWS